MRPEYIPNIITILRLVLIGPIIFTLLMAEYRLSFCLFLIAGITDAVDGYLARRFHWISRWGAMVDPLADKLLMVITFLTLGYLGVFPLWLLIMVVIREVVIVSGGTLYHFLIGEYEFVPTRISKVNTCLQIILTTLLMFTLSFPIIPIWFLEILMGIVFLTSLISLLDYIWVWGRRAWLHNKGIVYDK
jgi:Phosphatidylglycerophosphate synthase